jgi:hypothetical protein
MEERHSDAIDLITLGAAIKERSSTLFTRVPNVWESHSELADI